MVKIQIVNNKRNPNAGVNRSSRLIVSALTSVGDDASIVGEFSDDSDADAFWFYGWLHSRRTGRGPDVSRMNSFLSMKGPPMLINVGWDGTASRARWIIELLDRWPRAIAAVWTSAAEKALGHHHRVVALPKAFRDDIGDVIPFEKRSGYSIGDVSEFRHSNIIGMAEGAVQELIQTLTRDLGVKVYGYEGWGSGRTRKLIGITTSSPGNGLPQWLAHRKGVIQLAKFESFGMTIMESQQLGVPTIYPYMPQSMSEYVGAGGLPYRNFGDIVAAVKLLEDDSMWRSLSRAATLNATSRAWENHAPALHFGIERAIHRYYGE